MTVHPSVRRAISQVVEEWTEEGKMFTAFEVSLAAKERGIRERHRHLRDTVHELIFEIGGPLDYTRTLRDVGAPEQAWVYHLPADNPYRYRPLPRHDGPAVDHDAMPDVTLVMPHGIRNPIRLHTAAHAPAMVPAGAHGTDQRGRLCIPVALLAQMGIGPGQSVDVRCSRFEEKVYITRPSANQPQDLDARYVAEPDGNVRLTQMTLEKAGIEHLACYRIEGTAGFITVARYDWA
jgi:hypothetical protein